MSNLDKLQMGSLATKVTGHFKVNFLTNGFFYNAWNDVPQAFTIRRQTRVHIYFQQPHLWLTICLKCRRLWKFLTSKSLTFMLSSTIKSKPYSSKYPNLRVNLLFTESKQILIMLCIFSCNSRPLFCLKFAEIPGVYIQCSHINVILLACYALIASYTAQSEW